MPERHRRNQAFALDERPATQRLGAGLMVHDADKIGG